MESVKLVRPIPPMDEYLAMMRAYLEKIRSLPDDEAKEEAQRNFIEAGIYNKDGTPKENIVDNY